MSSSKARQELHSSASATELADAKAITAGNDTAIVVVNTSDLTVKEMSVRDFLMNLGDRLPGAVLVSPVDSLEAKSAMNHALKRSFKSKRRLKFESFFARIPSNKRMFIPLLPLYSFIIVWSTSSFESSPWAPLFYGLLTLGLSALFGSMVLGTLSSIFTPRKLRKFVAALKDNGYLSYDDYVVKSLNSNELTNPSLTHEQIHSALELFNEKRTLEHEQYVLSLEIAKIGAQGDSLANRALKNEMFDKFDQHGKRITEIEKHIAELIGS